MLLPALLAYVAPAAHAADLTSGKAIYEANCTACHGSAGNGKGPAAVALTPKPTDFTSAAYWEGKSDAQLVGSVKAGRPGTSMTAFTQLSAAELGSVVEYLRGFAAK
jgi:mono/diheme cytochrome c family protein